MMSLLFHPHNSKQQSSSLHKIHIPCQGPGGRRLCRPQLSASCDLEAGTKCRLAAYLADACVGEPQDAHSRRARARVGQAHIHGAERERGRAVRGRRRRRAGMGAPCAGLGAAGRAPAPQLQGLASQGGNAFGGAEWRASGDRGERG